MGKEWPSTEHFIQAQKYVGTPIAEKIRKCRSAREAFEMARKPQYQVWLRPDWHKGVKDDVMHLAVKEKFTQHRDLRKLLLGTGERDIIEHTTNDSYWGDGGGWGRGQNKLGKILMQVRDELRQSQPLDDCKEKFLPHQSSLMERELGKSVSSARPRSGSVGRTSQRMAEYGYGYEHSSRRDVQPTAGSGGTGREHSSRRDGHLTAGVGGQGKGSSTGRSGQPITGSGGTRREYSNRRDGHLTAGVGGQGMGSSVGIGVQATTGGGGIVRGAVSGGGLGKTVSQGTPSRLNGTHNQQPPSRPTSNTKSSRTNNSSQMAGILNHSQYETRL